MMHLGDMQHMCVIWFGKQIICFPSHFLLREFMFQWFKPNPQKKIKKEIQQRHSKAMQYQRNGKLREYAEEIAQIEVLEKKLQEM